MHFFVFIQAARAQGVDCIVAPYEADAQLAYLNKTNLVQAIITEDSDLLAFGCKKVFHYITLISLHIHGIVQTNSPHTLVNFVICPSQRL